MKRILKFKTNLKCENCVGKIKPRLDRIPEIERWSVEQKGTESILTVEMSDQEECLIEKILREEGYKAELCSKTGDGEL